jgi:hypothetical protein
MNLSSLLNLIDETGVSNILDAVIKQKIEIKADIVLIGSSMNGHYSGDRIWDECR